MSGKLFIENRLGLFLLVENRDNELYVQAEHHLVKPIMRFRVAMDSMERLNLLINIEEAMGLRKYNRLTSHIVRLPSNIEWSMYREDAKDGFAYCLRISWSWHTDDYSFNQLNSGNIWLTKEEVETLHHMFKGD